MAGGSATCGARTLTCSPALIVGDPLAAPYALEAYPHAERRREYASGQPVVSLPVQRSAEDSVWAEQLAIPDAIAAAGLSPVVAHIVRDCALGRGNVVSVARRTRTPNATAYRIRDRAYAALRGVLADAS